MANYDEQQLKSRRQNAKKHNYTSADDVPYGIQESCSHHPKNNLSVFTKEHRCPYCGNVLNGNQQQNQEKNSKIDKTSSVSELSDHNEMPTKNTNTVKNGLELPIQSETVKPIKLGESSKKHIVKDENKFCDNDFEKKYMSVEFNGSLVQYLMSLLFPDKSVIKNSQHSMSQATSQQSGTSDDHSDNIDTF